MLQSWIMARSFKRLPDALGAIVFSPPPLKFRTAGFPQYGFKPAVGGNLRPGGRRLRGLYAAQALPAPAEVAPPFRGGNRRSVSALRRGPSGPTGPEALGSASGYAVPSRHRLLRPHPRLSAPPGVLSSSSAGSSPRGPGAERVPAFVCESFRPCHLPYPGRPGGQGRFDVRP